MAPPEPPTHIRPSIMAGSSSEAKQQEDSNGSGTVRSSGGARKVVQWLDDHLNSQSQPSSSRHHVLDERGRDPKAFNSLTSALERHKSQQLPSRSTTDANPVLNDNETETKRRPSLIHYFPPRRNRSIPRINTQSLSPESHNRYSSASPPTTSTNSPPTFPNSPVNRADPPRPIEVPGQFIEPNERAGLPGTTNPEAFAEREAANIVRAHTTRRKGFFRGFRSGNRHSKSKPSGDPTDNRVKSHDYAAGPGHAPTNVEHLTAGVDAPRPHDLERDADTASIQTTASTADIVPPNSGILSALLALYNSQQRTNDEYDRLSSTTSGASTPAFEEVPERPWVEQQSPRGRGSGRYGSRRRGMSRSRSQSRETILEENDEAVDEFDEVFRKAHENAQATRRPTHVRVSSSPSPANRVQSRPLMSPPLPRPQSMPSPPPDYTHSPLSQSPQQMQSPQLHVLNEPQQEAHPEPPAVTQPQRSIPHKSSLPTLSSLNPFSTQRPAQARNAGGVIGPLIASTANISGAAAPANSRIAPNPKRPGYHLSRYSWEDRLPKFKKDKDRTKPTRRQSRSLDNADLPLGGEGSHSSRGVSVESDSTATHLPMTAPVSAYVSPPTPPAGLEKRESASGYFSSTTGNRAKWTGVLNLRGNAAREENVSGGTTSSVGEKSEKGGGSWGWSGRLTPGGYSGRNTPVGGKSGRSTPTTQNSSPRTPPALTLTPTPLSEIGEWISDAWFDKGRGEKDPEKRERRERDRLQREKDRERREKERKDKKRRKKAEIFITRHVAQILQRQEFLLKLARSMMMFGAPAHRLPAQIAATARVLEIPLSCLYLPDVMIISFDDMLGSLGTSSSTVSVDTGTDSPSARSSTMGTPPTLSAHTSSLKLLRQTAALDLGKLKDAYDIYWKVIHDEVSVADASGGLDDLMRRKVRYGRWQSMFIGGMCSASICSLSFGGSFVDCLAVFPLGVLLVFIQSLAARNELYSNVFEITITTLFSFMSAALASTNKICYSAVASSSIVLILPGFIVLSGALEVLSRNIVSGSVRMCYAVVYCLFLGFGLAMGAEAYQKITGRGVVGLADTACAYSHNDTQWWNSNVSTWWAFLTVPMFSLFLTMRNQGPLFKLEMLVTIVIACTGWVTNHFVGTVFVGQADISAAVGAFVVGFIANMYGRFFSGNAFVIMITGILFQVPSGLGNNGLLVFVDQQSSGSSESYLSGFQTALQLISVAIGLTVGLGISLFLAYPIQSRRRAGGVFSL
ncbi:pheromone-regulated protein prm10 [Marasmius tenuissimus]|nr:pheromone-regulated protein prm10 [Marasmius tenuissimus]